MQNKNGFLTSEFWLALIAFLIPLAVKLGFIAPEHQIQVANASTALVDQVISILPLIAYIWARVKVKTRGPL